MDPYIAASIALMTPVLTALVAIMASRNKAGETLVEQLSREIAELRKELARAKLEIRRLNKELSRRPVRDSHITG